MRAHALVQLEQRLKIASRGEAINFFCDSLKNVFYDPSWDNVTKGRLWNKDQGIIMACSILDNVMVATIYPEEQFIGSIREDNYMSHTDLSQNPILFDGKRYKNAQDFKSCALRQKTI